VSTAVKERPILFNSEMVRAVLYGRKTQTRRPVKESTFRVEEIIPDEPGYWTMIKDDGGDMVKSPFGVPGDRLWVRETWRASWDGDFAIDVNYREGDQVERFYTETLPGEATSEYITAWEWRPSIHMPRWASRIPLEITNIRVERVHDITEEDAQAEGCNKMAMVGSQDPIFGHAPVPRYHKDGSYKFGFKRQWDSIYANKGIGWNANPWVWVVEFQRL